MAWDGNNRRSGREKRRLERRGELSQKLGQDAKVTNRRKYVRRACDRAALHTTDPAALQLPNEETRWRELRVKTVGEPVAPKAAGRPKLRLLGGGKKSQDGTLS